MINPKIAAAVSVALGVAGLGATGLAQAAAPSLAQCVTNEGNISPNGTANTLAVYVSGSSAAQTGMAFAFGNDVFGGLANLTIIKSNSANKINFQAFCGVSNGSVAEFGASGTNVLIYYRAEGGSVSGLLPIIADSNGTATGRAPNSGQVNQLKLSGINQGAASCVTDTTFSFQTCTIAAADITGTSVSQGPTDAFGGAVQLKFSDIGVTDLEPAVFAPGNGVTTGVNYPTPYNSTIYGSMSVADIAAVGKKEGFQQAFGLYVNNGVGGGSPVELAQSTAVGLVNGTFSDWVTVPNAATPGSAATAVSTPVVWIDREVGSGSRAAFGIYFLGYGCGGSTKIPDSVPANDGWATSVVLAAVATTAGGITYASIDNAPPAGATQVMLGEATLPNNTDAAANVYPFWFESWFVQNSKSATHNQDGHGTGAALWTDIVNNGRFVLEASAPHSKQVSSIPGIGGTSTKNPSNALLTVSSIGGITIHNAAYSRGGNSCAAASQTTH